MVFNYEGNLPPLRVKERLPAVKRLLLGLLADVSEYTAIDIEHVAVHGVGSVRG